jgi:hypothetical protein
MMTMKVRGARRGVMRSVRAAAGLAALSTVVAACGSATTAGATRANHPGAARATVERSGTSAAAGSAGRRGLSVLSASFVSASTGWLLATPCAVQVGTCHTVVMRTTVDGGRTWVALPAPAASPADRYRGSQPANAVGAILFTRGGDGWAFGPALWQTRDGGLHWHKLSSPGTVFDLRVTGGQVLLLAGRCTDTGLSCHVQVYSAAGAETWRPVPGAAAVGVGSPQLAVSGGRGYLFATAHDIGRPELLGGEVTGSARWRPLPEPCAGTWSGAVAAGPGGVVFVGCGSEPGAGQQVKVAYLSADGGLRWRRVANPPPGGYLGGASMSRGGTIFLSGGRMDIYVSRDRGRSWQESSSLADAAGLADAGFPLTGSAITDAAGFATQAGVTRKQVWFTTDGGRDWTAATVR